jgi:hypothetical protein
VGLIELCVHGKTLLAATSSASPDEQRVHIPCNVFPFSRQLLFVYIKGCSQVVLRGSKVSCSAESLTSPTPESSIPLTNANLAIAAVINTFALSIANTCLAESDHPGMSPLFPCMTFGNSSTIAWTRSSACTAHAVVTAGRGPHGECNVRCTKNVSERTRKTLHTDTKPTRYDTLDGGWANVP